MSKLLSTRAERLARFNNDQPTSPHQLPPLPQYTGPPIPTAYDPNWQFYTNLTQAQIAAFQAMPEWAAYVATQPEINYGGDPAATALARASAVLK